ncbi:uncharacterized protein BX664DRAFT_326387 [Halteromyces radiatus]|uniref:uncharacterized protein n=1 Tax=Halteromyces radiatus TaxID=101107 RepID=UPI00221F02A6|nr:uncharacterized protein BX664DRAFT_326387 [Halteromyces radiatus]KAI8097448.1 hypothetical protein BX664DRAFT_326387 [Halteromyces radiatus]
MSYLQMFTLIEGKFQKQMLFLFFFLLCNLLSFFYIYIYVLLTLIFFTTTSIHLELLFFPLLIRYTWYP